MSIRRNTRVVPRRLVLGNIEDAWPVRLQYCAWLSDIRMPPRELLATERGLSAWQVA